MSRGNFYGEYYHYKNKYEEAQEELADLKHQIELRQQVIENYQEWFRDREYLSTLSEAHPRRKVRNRKGMGV